MASEELMKFVEEQGIAAEARYIQLNNYINREGAILPPHITDMLYLLRQHAEEDLSHSVHLQSILPQLKVDSDGRVVSGSKPAPVSGVKPAQVSVLQAAEETSGVVSTVQEDAEDDDIETAVAAGDDLFLLEGVTEGAGATQLLTTSEGEDVDEDDNEADEGIHIPTSRRKPQQSVAASLPVNIRWPEERTAGSGRGGRGSGAHPAGRGGARGQAAAGSQRPGQAQQAGGRAHAQPIGRRQANNNALADIEPSDDDDEEVVETRDIAASIQAMARSVHTSSMFGDAVFGDLPRPRLNTYSNK